MLNLIAKKFAFSFYLIAVTLIGGELVLRWLIPIPAVQLRIEGNRLARNPLQTQVANFDIDRLRFAPNSQGQIMHQEFSVAATHDQNGYRNPCYDFAKPATGILVGDSFAYGVGVEDEATFGCAIKRIIPAANHYIVGISGATPKMYLDMLELNQQDFEKMPGIRGTTLDVLLFMGNDFEALGDLQTNFEETPSPPPDWTTIAINTIGAINRSLVFNPILSESYLLQAIKIIALQTGSIKRQGEFYTDHAGSSFYMKSAKKDVTKYFNALSAFRSKAKDLKYTLGVVYLLPDASEVDEARMKRAADLARFEASTINKNYKFEVLMDACGKAGIACIDLRPGLTGSHYFLHDNHLSG